jgi:hypothetical protein
LLELLKLADKKDVWYCDEFFFFSLFFFVQQEWFPPKRNNQGQIGAYRECLFHAAFMESINPPGSFASALAHVQCDGQG